MIIFEFSEVLVASGKVPGAICQVTGRVPEVGELKYFQFAERVYTLDGTTAKMAKNRFTGQLEDFELTREDVVALVLKAIPLKS